MNSQCPPCPCREEAAQSNPCTAVAPEQNSQADPCPCQDLCPSCGPQTPLGVTSPSLPVADSGKSCADPVKIPSSGEEPFTFETPGMCVMRFPLQKSILTVELCPPDACLDERENLSLEKISLEKLPMAAPEPCTLEVLDLGEDEPCRAQGTIPGDPCVPQIGISTDPCAPQIGISQSQGIAEGGGSRTSPPSPFRLNSCTSSIVERCLSRCQSWFRGKK